MLAFTEPINIPDEAPFENDKLGRKIIGEKLTQFLKNTQEPLVLSIDAEWGQGKTTFLRMWQKMLKQEEFVSLYYSAWENDFNNDAFVTIIGELEGEINSVIDENGDSRQKLKSKINQTKELGSTIIKNSLPFLLKILTSGVINAENLSEDLGNLAKEISKEQIESYQKSKSDVEKFKQNLQELASEISGAEKRPLVIMIDELDRCRPDFALEVLERIKHFFLTPNLVFVLAIDKNQLVESIRTIYGSNLNPSGYLKRFIDIEFALPVPDIKKYTEVLEKRCGIYEYVEHTTHNVNRRDAYQIMANIRSLINYFDCTLREVEKIYSKLSYTIKITSPKYNLYPISTSFLILLSIKHYNLYKEFSVGNLPVDELFMKLEEQSEKLKSFVYSHEGIRIWGTLFIASATNDSVIKQKISSLAEEIEHGKKHAKKEFLKAKKKELLRESPLFAYGFMRYILQNIEMVSHFG